MSDLMPAKLTREQRTAARQTIYDLVGYFPGLSDAELAERGVQHGGRARNAGHAIIQDRIARELLAA